LTPVTEPEHRRLGVDAGKFEVPEDFNAPLPDEVVEGFES